jgi:hypothetical protein
MATTHQAERTQQTFPHRRNPDGTFDSICPHCFRTVSHQESESDLAEFERSHVCNSGGDRLDNLAFDDVWNEGSRTATG